MKNKKTFNAYIVNQGNASKVTLGGVGGANEFGRCARPKIIPRQVQSNMLFSRTMEKP